MSNSSSDYEYTIKFNISGTPHYMTISATCPQEAEDIFVEWLLGESGQMEKDQSKNKIWRKIHTSKGQETTFRNDWVASWEVMSKFFMIT